MPFVFRVAGIDAAQTEFPPQPGNGTYVVWGTPAFYREHRALDGFTQIALRFHRGIRDWPAVRQELSRHAHGQPIQAGLLASQSVNTQRSIRPQAVALWLLAAIIIHQLMYFIRQHRRERAAVSAEAKHEARVNRRTINGFYSALIMAVLAAWLYHQDALI